VSCVVRWQWPLAAAAQQSTNKKRLAIFSPAEPSADLHEHSESKFARALFAELRRLGWIEGQNLKVESYGREQNASGPEALATEIVRSNPDAIFVVGPGAVIFKKLTLRIPILVITTDPVKQGLAESLAHPGAISREPASTPVCPFMENGLHYCARWFRQCRNLAFSLFDFNGMGLAQALSAQLPKWQASLSRCLYWNLVPAKQTFGQRSRASPATVQMRSWSSIRLRSFKTTIMIEKPARPTIGKLSRYASRRRASFSIDRIVVLKDLRRIEDHDRICTVAGDALDRCRTSASLVPNSSKDTARGGLPFRQLCGKRLR